MKDTSARAVAVKVLTAADGPMTASEIAEQVLATPGVTLTGKTPKATVSAIVTSYAKKGKVFVSDGGKPQRYSLLATDAPVETEKLAAPQPADEPVADGDLAKDDVKPDTKPERKPRNRTKAAAKA